MAVVTLRAPVSVELDAPVLFANNARVIQDPLLTAMDAPVALNSPTFEVAPPVPSFVGHTYTYFQRVYDSVAGWCYYSTTGVANPSPSAGSTVPNHTSNLDAAKHAVTYLKVEE